MRQYVVMVAIAAGLGLSACDQGAGGPTEPGAAASQTEVDLTSTEAQISYTLGQNIGNQIKRDVVDLDMSAYTAGFSDGYSGADSQLTPEQMQAAMIAFQTLSRQKQEQTFRQVAETNAAEGEAFLAENATKEGVVTTESGLQYKVLIEGDGAKPTAEDTVTVNYRGTLLDGTVFDSSYDRGQPASFRLSGVIPGWTEGLQLMPVGSKYEFFIPSDLAYGPGGTGRDIGPNATLKFEVELLEIKE